MASTKSSKPMSTAPVVPDQGLVPVTQLSAQTQVVVIDGQLVAIRTLKAA